jgi:SulP family sulfate permease
MPSHGPRLPLPDWIAGYRRDWLGPDLIAGLTAAAVVIPMAMAYAAIAGLPLQVGLTTALVPMLVYALTGSSRVLSVSTTSTIAILVGAQLSDIAAGGNGPSQLGALVSLGVLVGLALVLAWVLRLGFIANFISHPVLVGFKAGVGLLIVIDQIPKLLGIHFTKGSFFHNLLSIAKGLPDLSWMTLAVGLMTIAILVGAERWRPRGPAPLIAVGAGIAASALFALQAHGVAGVGRIPEGLPSFAWPDFSLFEEFWPSALGIALMSFTETTAAGRAFASPDEPPPRPNQELLATGLANLAGAVLGAMPAGGGTSQTAVNRFSGARTQLATLVTTAVTLVTMLFLAPFVELMPQATLAAVVLIYASGMVNADEFRSIFSVRLREFIWIVVSFAGVVLLGTLKGITVAIIVSLLALAFQVSNPPVYVVARKPGTNVFRPKTSEHPEDESWPGLLLLRLDGLVFFANAEIIADKVRPLVTQLRPKVVAMDLSGVYDLEYTALKMLIEAEKRNRDLGTALWLVGLQPQVLTVVLRSPLGKTLGRESMFFNLEQAVAKYEAMAMARDANSNVMVAGE